MQKSNGFLSWVYKVNHTHDQMKSYHRHHTIIQLSFLILVISLLFPMAICLDTGLDFFRTAGLFFSICIAIACAFRIPYKMGKLNKYSSEKIKKQKAAEKEELEDLYEQMKQMQKEIDDLKNNQFFDNMKYRNKEDSYYKSQQQTKPKVNDWRLPYLKILGLDASATAEQIKSAYRKLAMKWHPDRNPGSAFAEAKFKEMKAAYEALC